jgi:diguanylate cyclase (GGDEF)-like protein
LYEVAQTLSASLGVQDTLEILARKLEAILPGTACVFLIRENIGQPGEACTSLVARAAVGVNRSFLDRSHTLSAQSLSLRVAQERETFLGTFDTDDLMLPGVQSALWTELNTALIVPIIHQGDVLGTINLYHPEENAFGPHDQQLLEMIAERAALALWNGLLFDRTMSHALTDALTGIANARCLIETINDRCAQAAVNPGEAFAILCIDLDSVKPINDNFGHLKGDQVLRDLAAILQRTIHAQDLVARYGGDEFVVVLDAVTASEAYEMAERLQSAVMAYNPGLVHPRLGALRLGASVGVACFPHDGADCTTLLSAADANMYREKSERKLGRLVGSSLPSYSNDRFASAPASSGR